MLAGDLLCVIDKRHHGVRPEPKTERTGKTEGTVVTLPLPKPPDQSSECDWVPPKSLEEAAAQAAVLYAEVEGILREEVTPRGVRIGKFLLWGQAEHKRQKTGGFVKWMTETVGIPTSTGYICIDLAENEEELRSRSEDLGGLVLTEEVKRIREKKRAAKKPKAPPPIPWPDNYDPPDKEHWFDTSKDLWVLEDLWQATKMDWKSIVKEDGVTGVRAQAVGQGTPYKDKFSVFPGVLAEFVYLRGLNGPPARILDPSTGGPVRGAVAAIMGYELHGIDKSAAQIAENIARCADLPLKPHYYVGDGTRAGDYVEGPFDLLFTCPPYWNKEIYSGCEGDLSACKTYDEYLDRMEEMARNARPLMKSGAPVYLVLGHIRDPLTEPPREYLDIAGDVARRFQAAGFIYQHRLAIKFPDGGAAANAGGMWKDHKHYYPVTQSLLYLRTP